MVVVFCKWCYPYLLGLSKGNARVEIPDSLFFRSVANRSQVLITHAQPFDSHAKYAQNAYKMCTLRSC